MNTNSIAVALGTAPGARHLRLGRPNQDAGQVIRTDRGVVLAVCDGCGSGARSEVGAAVGARLWCDVVAAHLDAELTDQAIADLGARVLERLAVVATALGADRAQVTRELLLFTSVVAAVTADAVTVWAIGDGVIGLGDALEVLGPFPDNAPPYLAEAWFGCARAPVIRRADPTAIDRVVIATDGASPLVEDDLAALADAPLTYANPASLSRRLRQWSADDVEIDWVAQRTARTAARLDDDTTIACARWGRS